MLRASVPVFSRRLVFKQREEIRAELGCHADHACLPGCPAQRKFSSQPRPISSSHYLPHCCHYEHKCDYAVLTLPTWTCNSQSLSFSLSLSIHSSICTFLSFHLLINNPFILFLLFSNICRSIKICRPVYLLRSIVHLSAYLPTSMYPYIIITLFIWPISIYLYLSFFLSIHIYRQISISLYTYVYLSAFVSIILSSIYHLSIYLSISICLPVYLCIYLSFDLSTYLPYHLFVCLSVSICLSVHPLIHPSTCIIYHVFHVEISWEITSYMRSR